jgi:sugar transferase (PEP-CTERM/EpsH1 system associated)
LKKTKPIIAHLIYRFDIGGLERVMVNCINAMKNEEYQHVVIALTDVTDFSKHLNHSVDVYQLNKQSGKDLMSHWRLFKLLRKVKPDLLHTYNLATIEYHPISIFAGVKAHIHAEHGRDNADPKGLNKKHNLLRQLLSPFINYFVPVSLDLFDWLKKVVNIKANKLVLIRNGININEFNRQRESDDIIKFIHVARLDLVKDQAGLISAFAHLVKKNNLNKKNVQLTIVGDGVELSRLNVLANELNIANYIEFTGARSDIANLLSNADVFVLSSIAEGIPMTVLEGMASSLPVISTNVGGLPELITNNINGYLVDKQNIEQLSLAMENYIKHPELIIRHGKQARCFIEDNFSEQNMVDQYLTLYKKSLGQG